MIIIIYDYYSPLLSPPLLPSSLSSSSQIKKKEALKAEFSKPVCSAHGRGLAY